jgi:Mitochondrial carrier protein
MLAGGIGGTSGDLLMHSLDTVKTRQQGDPHFPPKYTSMSGSYLKIFRQEGLRRGLYGGVTAAMLGSFPGTVIFFGTYEYCKRHLLDRGVNPSISFLTGGMLLAPSLLFVANKSQALSQILQPRSCMYLLRFSRPAYSFKAGTTTLTSILATTTDQLGMRQRQ